MPHDRRILVIANETVVGEALHDAIAEHAGEVFVVAPALNSRLRHWVSDVDGARRGAEERLQQCIDRLAAQGIEARGWVGDADPLQAIEDALKVFAADELILATHPEGRSHWLERDLVRKARERFSQPIRHVVVSLDWIPA
jgi:GNAT superfamily N-acetyltransferase